MMGDETAGNLPALTAWLSSNAVWLVVISVSYFLVSLFLLRFLIIRMPAEYFMGGRKDPSEYSHPVVAISVRIAKNLLGIVVIVVGIVMSIPGVAGQGFLTILLGLSLTDFPGKRKLELRLVRQPMILRAINGLREKAGKPPLTLPDPKDGPDSA